MDNPYKPVTQKEIDDLEQFSVFLLVLLPVLLVAPFALAVG